MWRRLRKLFREPGSPESAQAIESAKQDLAVAESRGQEVRRVAAELRAHREINHFAERIRASMRGA